MPRRQRSDVSDSSGTRISTVLDDVRRQLQDGGGMARRTAPSIHIQTVEADRPNLGLLCEQIAELMDGIAGKLVVALVLRGRSPLALAIAIEEQRRRLRRTQAVLQTAAYFSRTAPEPKVSELLVTFENLATICESALTALDPTALGLPISKPDI